MLETIDWFSKGIDWIFTLLVGAIAFVYKWLDSKISGIEKRMAATETKMLEDKIENMKTYVNKVDLEKLEMKIDRLHENIQDFKDKILTKD